MADASLVIRVAANLDELKSNMAEGRDQIEVVQQALAKMATSYDGSKIISQANATVAAISQIGGVSNLTDAEMAKVNATLGAAIDKYDALGQDAPTAMKQLYDQTVQVDTEHSNLLTTLKDVAAAFGLAYSVEGAVHFVEQVVEQANELKNLSLQTNINIEDLQVLSAATRDYGVSGDELGRALFALQQRIAGGDSSVATAYHLMGMSLDEVKDKDPMELFLATERGLGTLSGAIQDTAAKDLYGGKLGASLIAFSKGADDAIAKAKSLNTIASTESVKAAAEYAEAIDRVTNSIKAYATEVIGGAAMGADVLAAAADKGASKWSIFKAMLEDWMTSSTLTGGNATHLATLLDGLNTSTGHDIDLTAQSAQGHKDAVVALDAHGQAAQFMAALELDATKPLLAWQLDYLDHLKTIGQLTAQNAAAIGVNADQFAKYQASIEDAKKALEDWDKELVARAAAEKTAFSTESAQLSALEVAYDAYEKALQAGSHDTLQVQINDVYLAADAKIASLQKTKTLTDATEQYIRDAADATVAHLIQNNLEADVNSKAHFQLIADRAQAAFAFAEAHADEFTTEYLQKLRDTADAAQLTADSWGTSFGTALDGIAKKTAKTADDIVKTWDQAMALVAQDKGEMSGSVSGNYALNPNSTVSLAAQAAAMGGTVAYDSYNNPYAYIPGVTAAPSRDSGGSVAAGQPYYIGTGAQPELFVPSTSGTMIPNGAGGTSIVFQFHITQPLGTPSAIAAAIGPAVMSSLRASGVRLPVTA